MNETVGKDSIRNRWLVISVIVAATALGVATSLSVLPGLPYDEPAHWSNALFLASKHQLPVIGHFGTTYEAQQGPLAYVAAALIERLGTAVSGGSRAFYEVRMLGGVEFLVSAYYVRAILQRIAPLGPGRLIALATYLIAPMFVAMFWSVQNDGLCLALSFAALAGALKWGAEGFNLKRAALIGAVCGLALITKLSAFAILFAIPLWFIMQLGMRRGIRLAGTFGLGVLVFSGWWFVWNLATYGRLIPPTRVDGRGPSFAAYGFHGMSTAKHVIENVITYLWVPSEYYRNLVSFSGPIKALVLLATLLIFVIGLWTLASTILRKQAARHFGLKAESGAREAWSLIGLTAVIAGVGWLFLFVRVSAVAPRIGYLALPAWFGLVAIAFNRVAGWLNHPMTLVCVTLAGLVGLNVWVLEHAARLSQLPFQIHL